MHALNHASDSINLFVFGKLWPHKIDQRGTDDDAIGELGGVSGGLGGRNAKADRHREFADPSYLPYVREHRL